ncbi:DUF1156 domain-containing protein [Mucilaginibacter sp.]|jgi:adenine-specific DNA methylase|uniref:DUF1156 domain-containing protein n=1 Tax=Mucilaginibacter sp. TaxID=1882438 RepID=UPI00356168C2
MGQPKKLIEVAMPIKEISAESVRDGRIQHGHISSLHKWWARRPLPVCRAVIFASLIPDPLDENCPQIFKDAVELLIGKGANIVDIYRPYDDIPYTAAVDKMDDNLRNRLLMFIGKFSEKYCKLGEKTASKEVLTEYSLIKWENKNNETVLTIARKLIWVAYNSIKKSNVTDLLMEYDAAFAAIKSAELNLYSSINRQRLTDPVKEKELFLRDAINFFLNRMPKVFDPFAGGGAIPLEASRLGCRSYGNDINPVAHIIQKASLEFPQKYGKPIVYDKQEFIKLYGERIWESQLLENKEIRDGEAISVRIENRLAFDVEFYASKLLLNVENEIGYLYPKSNPNEKIIAYYWTRVGICANPSCRAEVPLLKQFYLCNTKNKQIHLKPIIENSTINFEIKSGVIDGNGWVARGNLVCPCCGNTTENKILKEQFVNGNPKERLIAVIYEGKKGKEYRLPNQLDIDILNQIPEPKNRPKESLPVTYTKAMAFCLWGFNNWGDIFTKRQLVALNALVDGLKYLESLSIDEDKLYWDAIITYLALIIDKIASRQTSFGIIDIGRETIVDPFSKQAIQMVFDYPEQTPFSIDTAYWISLFIQNESPNFNSSICNNASSGDKSQFENKFIDAVITDPPYYDAIAYADISDFYYIWLKRSIGSIYPLNFSTPQTPKSEECTALKHHFDEDITKAKNHFENKLMQVFDAIEHQTSDIVSIMFAHQSTEAWTTLCNSILGSRMNITGSWANDTELTGALKTDKAFLSSSVTVACRPSQRQGFGDFKMVKKEIEKTVAKEVHELYSLGFRGADLLTACFGQAVSEFGKYEKVEKADGSEVTVADLLEMARESAFNALLKGFDGDDFTKFYIGWLQLYGFSISDFDDAAKFSRVGLNINVADLFNNHILIKNGNKQTLGDFTQRLSFNKNLGERSNSFLIDQVHRAMALYKGTNRSLLLQYIERTAAQPEGSFWRVVTSLCEILSPGSDDQKQALGLLTNKDSLIRESQILVKDKPEQTALELK